MRKKASDGKTLAAPVAERQALVFPDVITVSATEMQNNFGKYVDAISRGSTLILSKNNRKIARIVPMAEDNSYTPITKAMMRMAIEARKNHPEAPEIDYKRMRDEKYGDYK